jgi:hypothetical protein
VWGGVLYGVFGPRPHRCHGTTITDYKTVKNCPANSQSSPHHHHHSPRPLAGLVRTPMDLDAGMVPTSPSADSSPSSSDLDTEVARGSWSGGASFRVF